MKPDEPISMKHLEQVGGQLEHVVGDSELLLALRPLLHGEMQVDLLRQDGG